MYLYLGVLVMYGVAFPVDVRIIVLFTNKMRNASMNQKLLVI